MSAPYYIETFPVGAFQCNCSLLVKSGSRECMVVDPGDEFPLILDRIHALGLSVRALWHSHAHIDHIGATKALFETLTQENAGRGEPAPRVYLHAEDRWLYENVAIQAKMLGLYPFEIVKDFTPIVEGQTYEEFPEARALHTPGHTPGSSCLRLKAGAEIEVPRPFQSEDTEEPVEVLFSGDTLFREGIGRTDLWGGDGSLIIKSIRGKLFGLKEETVVIPGHGPLTTIGYEKRRNPFVKV